MKKLFFLVPFAALAMASCSNSDEVFESAPQAKNTELKLFPQIQGNTRGVVETTASLSSFEVILNGSFATTVSGGSASAGSFGPIAVTKGADGWSMATKYYWGDDTTPALFTAYANNGTAAYTAGTIKDFTVAADPADHKDLIVAYNSGSKTDFASGVPLHFQHALSQIIVNATYANDADEGLLATFPELKVKVKGVKFMNVDKKGTLTLPTTSTVSGYTADWTLGNTLDEMASTRSVAVELGSASQAIDNSAVAGPMLLLPQEQTNTTDLSIAAPTGSYLMVQVDIDYAVAKEGKLNFYPKWKGSGEDTGVAENEFAWIAVPVNIAWQAGYKYTYTLNFSNIACGKLPQSEADYAPTGVVPGQSIIQGVRTPVTFLVTVESEWTEQNVTPAL